MEKILQLKIVKKSKKTPSIPKLTTNNLTGKNNPMGHFG